jgi:hypothetical protein
MLTSAALPDTTHTHACTDTRDATSPTQHNGTAASWRVSPKTAHTYNPHNAHRTHTQHTNTHVPHARTTSCTATAHRSDNPTHHPQKITPSHTRAASARHTHRRAVRSPSVGGMLPESWLLVRYNSLQDTRTAIASHHGTRRRCLPRPASRTQRISAHRIASRMKASQHTASYRYRSRTPPCATDSQTTQPDSPQVPDAVIPPHHPATLRRSHKSQRDHSDAMHVQTSARHTTTTTQQLQTASECRKGRICR